mgnify:CR=1 FL=1
MRFLSYTHEGRQTFGAVNESGVVDLGIRHDALPDLREAIRSDKLAELAVEATTAPADVDIADIEFLPTIPNPEKINTDDEKQWQDWLNKIKPEDFGKL